MSCSTRETGLRRTGGREGGEGRGGEEREGRGGAGNEAMNISMSITIANKFHFVQLEH